MFILLIPIVLTALGVCSLSQLEGLSDCIVSPVGLAYSERIGGTGLAQQDPLSSPGTDALDKPFWMMYILSVDHSGIIPSIAVYYYVTFLTQDL